MFIGTHCKNDIQVKNTDFDFFLRGNLSALSLQNCRAPANAATARSRTNDRPRFRDAFAGQIIDFFNKHTKENREITFSVFSTEVQCTNTVADKSLAGKIALVTGGSRGIGRAIAIALGHAGATVAINYKSNADAAREAVATIQDAGGQAHPFRADVSLPNEVEQMLGAVRKELGAVTILVNNAGIAQPRKIDSLDLETFDEAIRVNLRSAFLVTNRVVSMMRQARWGRIIFISSTAANVGGVVGPHYAASKAGLIGLMHAYASALVKEGITANAISPALIETDMVRSDLQVNPSAIPVGRFGQPEEIADIAIMLVGNGYITGQTINVNGGIYPTS